MLHRFNFYFSLIQNTELNPILKMITCCIGNTISQVQKYEQSLTIEHNDA